MNCIKCGREIPDGELFCVECSLAPTPQESSRPPVQKVSKSHRQAKPSPEKAAHSEPKPKKVPRPAEPEKTAHHSRKAAVALVIVCILLAASLIYIGINFGGLAVQRAALRAKEADLTLRENELSDLEQQLAELSAQLDEANTAMTDMESEISRLEDQLLGSQSTMSQAQYDMTSQQQELEKLTAENTELVLLVDDLEGQVKTLTDKVSQLNASNAIYSEKASFMDSYVVFVNNDGSKQYHKYSCSDFKKQSFWAYSRKLAESNGYSACSKCCG